MNASNNDYWVQGLLRFLTGEPHRSGKALLFFCVRAKARACVVRVAQFSKHTFSSITSIDSVRLPQCEGNICVKQANLQAKYKRQNTKGKFAGK